MTTQTEALKLALETLESERMYFWNCPEKIETSITAIKEALAQPEQEPDYAYPTIEDYEEIVGFKVNDAFKMAWAMARTTNDLFAQMTNQMEQS